MIGPHCGFKNSEVQSGTEISEKGCLYTLRVTNEKVRLLYYY